jgi:transposase-like protein
MAKLTKEQIMVGADMAKRGASIRQIAKQLGVTEGALRYRLKQRAEGPKSDGRSFQSTSLDGFEDAVTAVLR